MDALTLMSKNILLNSLYTLEYYAKNAHSSKALDSGLKRQTVQSGLPLIRRTHWGIVKIGKYMINALTPLCREGIERWNNLNIQ